MPKGRPVASEIRQHIVEILNVIGKGYGYDIYQIYDDIYPRVSMRVIYYHLKKGLQTGEFRVDKVKQEQGNYSWGSVAEKVYYALGENARPKADPRVKEALDKRKQKK